MNNRQAGRRRGRGGQRSQGGGNPNRPDNGNRIDNRARGNAAQLLEKYKNLARDSQMQGDRVTTEYYLQFADHYFRVLSETRSRFEESGNRRPQSEEDEDEFDMEGEPGTPDQYQNERRDNRQDRDGRQDSRPEREGRQDRDARPDRGERFERGERPERNERGPRRERDDTRRERGNGRGEPAEVAAAAPAVADGAGDVAPAEEAPRRRGRPRRQPEVEAETAQPSIDADRLPPSLGLINEPEAEDAPKPRRRRKLRVEDDETASSAA